MENNTLCNRHSLGVNNHTKMYVTYTRIYGWSDYGGESSYQPGYRLENMMWMTLLVYDYIIPGECWMGEVKQHQPPMTIDEQIENLKNIGLIVEDEEYAKRILNDISYFRLIKAYSLNLKTNEGRYRENITFQQLVDLYLFNANFRQIIFPEIEKIEINVRCRISNYFAEKYGVLGYLEADNFVNVKYHQEFLKDVHEEIRRNSKAPFVKNFRMNYAGGMLPIYALVEVFSFGTLSKFYKNMKNPDKKAIAKSFGIGYTYLESGLESISYVRNICAHYGRLYNAKLSKTPMLYKEYSEAGIGNNRIFGVLLCLKHILKNDNHWNMFVDKIEILFDKYENVDITTMGFKENWKALLENDK